MNKRFSLVVLLSSLLFPSAKLFGANRAVTALFGLIKTYRTTSENSHDLQYLKRLQN